jgi:hypothetical protein
MVDSDSEGAWDADTDGALRPSTDEALDKGPLTTDDDALEKSSSTTDPAKGFPRNLLKEPPAGNGGSRKDPPALPPTL